VIVSLIALSVLCALLLGTLVYVIRHNDEQNETREAAWRLERTGLLNRIQVPEAAPFMDPATPPNAPPVQHVPFEDDEAFQRAMQESGLATVPEDSEWL
jgi:hypothetical protein